MAEWDPMKMLDLYIHDYLVRKNMHATAQIFAMETNVYPKNVAVNPPEGFLHEWWSLFWDTYSSRLPNDLDTPESSASKAIQIADNVLQNNQPNMPFPDVNYVQQNVCPATLVPGVPNLLQTGSPVMIPRLGMGNFLPNVVTPSETNLNIFKPVPAPGINMSQGTAVAMHEHVHPRLLARDMSSNSLVHGDLPFPHAPSSPGNSRQPQKKKSKNKRQLSVNRDDKSTAAETSRPTQEAMQIKREFTDTGSSTSSNSTRSDRGS